MGGVEQLRPEERAVIELILCRGQSYGQIGRALNVPESRARELAHRAIARLDTGGTSERPRDWPRLADYVLGQQAPGDADRTRSTLKGSAPARRWVRSVTDALRPLLGSENEPWVPREPAPSLRREPPLATVIALTLLLLVVLALTSALAGGVDRDPRRDRSAAPPAGPARVVGQVLLRGVAGARGQGLAGVVEERGRRRLLVQLRLPPTGQPGRYIASLGGARAAGRPVAALRTDRAGTAEAATPLPPDAARFRFLDVRREDDRAPGRAGRLILRGALPR